MPDIFFTSDTHFNHANVIQHSARPYASLEEMTESLIGNWNSVVSRHDTVYHLGDFALSWGKRDAPTIDKILSRLSGSKYLITGNHDRKEVTTNPRWALVTPYHELKLDLGDVHRQRIVLCHYAFRTWRGMHRGSWHLHGHSHGSLPQSPGRTMDVGVDCNNYYPVSLGKIREFMSGRPIFSEDHHQPKIPP